MPGLIATAGLVATCGIALAFALLWRRERARIARQVIQYRRLLEKHDGEQREALVGERALLGLLPDPVLVLGLGNAVLRANPAATATFGPGFSTLLRQPALRAAIDRALAMAQRQCAELTFPVPVETDVLATVVPLTTPLQDGGRVMVILQDRTRESAVERVRADFVANASHELRTPLASIIGFIDTLRGPAADDPPAQARFLGIMAEQARRMNRLIDDLLSLSRIELKEHQPPAEQVDLADLVRRLCALFEPQVASRRMTLDLRLPSAAPWITGDEDQLSQVLQNLLDNAVKYGREGGTLRVLVAPPLPGHAWPARPGLLLSVADDGNGIARAHIPRLTERFYRVEKHRSREVGGTGLGLAIVKHIVIRHRGQLAIESTDGQGTTVMVWLPLAGSESGAADTA